MPVDVVEGWTDDLDFQLKGDGVAVNVTGMTVDLVLKDNTGAVVDTVGDISVVDAVNGKVRYTPDPTDFTAAKSPFTARFKVTTGQGKIAFFPSGPADVWRVHVQ